MRVKLNLKNGNRYEAEVLDNTFSAIGGTNKDITTVKGVSTDFAFEDEGDLAIDSIDINKIKLSLEQIGNFINPLTNVKYVVYKAARYINNSYIDAKGDEIEDSVKTSEFILITESMSEFDLDNMMPNTVLPISLYRFALEVKATSDIFKVEDSDTNNSLKSSNLTINTEIISASISDAVKGIGTYTEVMNGDNNFGYANKAVLIKLKLGKVSDICETMKPGKLISNRAGLFIIPRSNKVDSDDLIAILKV